MINRLTNVIPLAGNVSQVPIAGSVPAELYMKLRGNQNAAAGPNPDVDGGLSPSSSQTPLAA